MIDSLEPFERYAEKISAPEPALLRRLREETVRTRQWPQMIAGHLQGRFLAFLTTILKPKRVLEIGTFVGYSALCFAEALPRDGKVVTIDCDPSIRPIAQRYFKEAPYGRKIELRIGMALKLLRRLKGPFELVYIDADKTNYSRYYDAVFRKVPSGGVLVADNILWSGAVLDKKAQDAQTKALRSFARKVQSDRRVEPLLLTIRDGLLVVRKK
ncbi:MAG: class I SAM-dependent methyltransferase [Candidatus Omnitrophica bacterium]|nr:class I SAM-dependent methyltransferase [Candidatus Omnitrophota bacterium]